MRQFASSLFLFTNDHSTTGVKIVR